MPPTQAPFHHATDPAALLRTTFAAIAATRMNGLPVCNPALEVAVPEMHLHDGEWLGVMVTPWTLSLVLLPGPGGRFRPVEVGGTQEWAFPSGVYEFMGNSEPGLGYYQTCSLFSPAFEFADQNAAENTARAAFVALLRPDQTAIDADARERTEGARLSGQTVAQCTLDRRSFLRGALFGGRP